MAKVTAGFKWAPEQGQNQLATAHHHGEARAPSTPPFWGAGRFAWPAWQLDYVTD